MRHQNVTLKTPKTRLDDSKRVKMIATLGPSSNTYSAVLAMLKSGVNGFRLNFSHGTHEERIEQIAWIRKASAEYGKPVAIIQDLQGPKIRLGDFEGVIEVAKGQQLKLKYKGNYERDGIIPIQYDLSKKVKAGDRIFFFDGRLRGTVMSVRSGVLSVKSENKGMLTKRKGINVPDTDFEGDIITKKDRDDIAFGATQDIDYVAMSFVQTAEDIQNIRSLLKKHGSDARVIAKIETRAATERLAEIVGVSDAVMVARGDLAIETEPESVPIIAREIIGLAQEYEKISIVATQMLASMTQSPEPTRAEVSDVATAVIVGADCVMLSDETASGDYPIEAVAMMKRIIKYTQANTPLKPVFYRSEDQSLQGSISSAVITLAHQVGARAIVVETRSGLSAMSIASHRPSMPIIMVTSSRRTVQQLALVYGGKVFRRPDSKAAAERLTDWLKENKIFKSGDIIVSTSGKYPGLIGGTDTVKVRVVE